MEKKNFLDDFVFVTTGDMGYMPFIEKLVDSLLKFSNRKIIVYGADCQVPFDRPNLIKRDLKYEKHSIQDKWYWKQYSNIQSIEEEPYQNYVWLDGDVIANYNIDNFSNYFPSIENYPLSDIHTQQEHFYSEYNDGVWNSYAMNSLLCEYFGVDTGTRVKPIAHVCGYVYNKECKKFFEDVLNVYKEVPSDMYRKLLTWNDEGAHNFILTKNGMRNHLPLSNLDLSYYDNDKRSFASSGLDNFIAYWAVPGPYNFGKIYAYEHIPENKNQILYFHGNKNINLCDRMIEYTDLFSTGKFYHSDYFYVDKFTLDGRKSDLGPNTLEQIYLKGEVLDIGAKIGVDSREFYRRGASRVISFESDRDLFILLDKNSDKRSLLFNSTLGSKMGKIEKSNSSDPYKELYPISVYTLDYLFSSECLKEIDLLKISMEDDKLDIFEGISDSNLSKVNKILLKNPSEKDRTKLIPRLERNNFSFKEIESEKSIFFYR